MWWYVLWHPNLLSRVFVPRECYFAQLPQLVFMGIFGSISLFRKLRFGYGYSSFRLHSNCPDGWYIWGWNGCYGKNQSGRYEGKRRTESRWQLWTRRVRKMFSVISTLPILISILFSSYGYGNVKRTVDLISKTKTLDSHHTFWFFLRGPLHVKILFPSITRIWPVTHTKIIFFLLYKLGCVPLEFKKIHLGLDWSK